MSRISCLPRAVACSRKVAPFSLWISSSSRRVKSPTTAPISSCRYRRSKVVSMRQKCGCAVQRERTRLKAASSRPEGASPCARPIFLRRAQRAASSIAVRRWKRGVPRLCGVRARGSSGPAGRKGRRCSQYSLSACQAGVSFSASAARTQSLKERARGLFSIPGSAYQAARSCIRMPKL